MANLNVNIANKLLSYVRHGIDVTDEIARVYRNSMIFIGDEQQIYVPVMQAYVGIGMTAYNNTINRIAGVEEQIDKLGKTLASDMVTKLYANYSLTEVNDGNNGIQYTPGGETFDTITEGSWALNNEITIKGVNDYDPETGFARKNVAGSYYSITNADNDTIYVVNSNYYHNDGTASGSALPTSGIKVTPHWGAYTRVENPATGQAVEKRVGNYIEIDDSLTWSYMTSAYAYTLNFARNFTNSEIDKVYHDLLGDSSYAYNPVLFSSVVTDVTDEINKLSQSDIAKILYDFTASTNSYYIEPGKRLVYNASGTGAYYTVDVSRTFYYASYTTNALYDEKTYGELTEDQLLTLIAGNDTMSPNIVPTNTKFVVYDSSNVTTGFDNFPQLYTQSYEYGSTYNMNIADGINTLKEVAYLLDLLSDGSLGSVTYLTYAEYNSYTNNGIDTEVVNVGTYYVLNPIKNNPANDDQYGYFIKTGDPENLGINIAYSIAGNKVQIDDLHTHTDAIEKGESSLRSIQSTSSNYVNLNIEGNKAYGEWANTDTNQGNKQTDPSGNPVWDDFHPNANPNNSYVVGDVNLRVNVQTGITYTTVYNENNDNDYNPKFVDPFGIIWYGEYTAADMKNLTADGTYYLLKTDASNPADNPCFELVTNGTLNQNLDYHNQTSGLQYYWIPLTSVFDSADSNSEYYYDNTKFNDSSQNAVYTKIDVSDLNALAEDETLPGTTIVKGSIIYNLRNQDNSYTEILPEGGMTSSQRIAAGAYPGVSSVYYISSHELVVLNSWVPSSTYKSEHPNVVEDALATTDWTYAFVSSKLNDITNDLEDILTQAKDYTDKKIDSLDTNYIYSDFNTYWTSYITYHGIIAGSVAYNTAYADEYAKFKNDRNNETYLTYVANDGSVAYSDEYRLSYQAKSKYAYNVIEENGIVSLEIRELPTDKLIADVEIWGAEENSTSFEYSPVTIVSGPTTDDKPFIESLFNWAASNADNQVFVKVTNGTYQKLPAQTLANFNNTYYLTDAGTYTPYPGDDIDAIGKIMSDYADTLDKYWRQLYVAVDKYYELDLPAATAGTPDTSVVVNGYTLDLNGNNVRVNGTGDYGIVDNVLYYISNRQASSTKYFTVENKHHSFDHNGEGENTLGLTAHITKLEDAAANNTGFADAYDVQSYIENTLTWVDVSATVTNDIVETSNLYYRHVTLEDFINDNYTSTESGQLYKYSSGTFSTENSPLTAYYWADDNKYIGTSVPGDTTGHIQIEVGGTPVYYVQRYNAKGFNTVSDDNYYSSECDYYVKIEDSKINPLNLTLTRYQ